MDVDEVGFMLEDKGLSHEEIDAYFEHVGVKGMKWGVRRQKRLDRATRVASGTATRRDKLRFALTDTSQLSVLRNKGLSGAAATRAKELQQRKERIQLGKATVKDFLALHGGDKLWVKTKVK